MSKDTRQKIQIGERLIRFTREADGIVALSLFQPRSCRMMIEAIRGHAGWATAKVSRRGADGEIRSIVDPESRMASVLFSEHLGAVGQKFDERMNTVLKPLVRALWGRDLTDHQGTQLVHYTPGGHYRAHSDVGPRTRERYYSVLCYLNDGFEGGGTWFPALGYSITPRCGKAIIFPSDYQHGGLPVTSGEKYVIVSWITGPVPEEK